MISALLKSLKHLLVPYGFLFFLICLAPVFALPKGLWPFAGFYPAVLFGIAAVLCWGFHRDRYVFAIISIALCERAVYYLFTGPGEAIRAESPIYAALGVLLPINLIIFELVRDRGVLTFRGSLRWLLIAAEVCFLGIAYISPGGGRAADLQVFLDRLAFLVAPGFLDPVQAIFGIALVVVLIRFLLRQVPSESSSFWVLGLLYLGIYYSDTGPLAVYYLSSASLIYIAAILDTSYRLAFRDELTELPARRALNDQLMRLSSKYAIAMADIDHFKKFNDTYGHDVGDQVLKMVAAKLSAVSGGGRVYRYGGEEFAIVFAGGTAERAKPCLEALRKEIESKKFTLRGFGRAFRKKKSPQTDMQQRKSVRITVSFGVAEKCDRHPDPQAVLQAADKALYRAKRSGRNRVAT